MVDPFSVNSIFIHCLQIYKLHFLSIFFIKNESVLFTHLKIILLQYLQFSIFSFSKTSSIQHIMMIRGHEGQTFEGCLPLFPGIEN